VVLVAIKGFRHKGLEQFFATGMKRGIQGKHADRLRLILGRLNVAATPGDMNLPGLALHELQGARKGTWAVNGPDVTTVDYEDYH
jgi:proteic killer suppression protein